MTGRLRWRLEMWGPALDEAPTKRTPHGNVWTLRDGRGVLGDHVEASDLDAMRRTLPSLAARFDALDLDGDDVDESLHEASRILRTARALAWRYTVMRGRWIERGAWRVDDRRRLIVTHDLDVAMLQHAGDPAAELGAVAGVLLERLESRLAAVESRLYLDGLADRSTIRAAGRTPHEWRRGLRLDGGGGWHDDAPLGLRLHYAYGAMVTNPPAGFVLRVAT